MIRNESQKQSIFLIANILKDLNNIEEYLPNINQTSIAGKKIKYKRKIQNKKIIEYENDILYNFLEKKLIMKNGETYEGIIGKKIKEIYLKKGIYIWPSGNKYIGSFNDKNIFHGFGKLKSNTHLEFESEFLNGFPFKNGKLRCKIKEGKKLYIQSDFKNKKVLNLNKIIYDGKTFIEISKNNEKIFNLYGIFRNGKLIDNVLVNKRIDNNRFIEIRTFFKDGKIDGLLQIKDTSPGNTFQFLGEYKYGYKDGFFKIKDTLNNIQITEEFHDMQTNANIIKKILKKNNKEIMKLLIEIYRKKLLEIKYNKLFELIKKILKIYLKQYFKKIKFYLSQNKYLSLFNKKYKTNYNFDIEIIHINEVKLGIDGLNLICKIYFLNLIEISLNEVDIKDFSYLKNANFPKLKILSLGKNNISSIDFIHLLPFPKLENLMLGVNIIKDLSPLKTYKSNYLKALFLLDNKISDISPIISMDTPNLEFLYFGSYITDINPLINCKFTKLKQLSFCHNKIQDISALKECNFPNLELLILSNNKIDKFDSLLKAKFPKLNEMTLKNNLIKSSNNLSKLPNSFPNLKKLDISKNKFNIGADDFNTLIFFLKTKIKYINY